MIKVKQNILFINYLNFRAVNLLETIEKESPIKSIKLIEKVSPIKNIKLIEKVSHNNEKKLMSESTFYRYITLLVNNKLVDKSYNRSKYGGYLYTINDNGRSFLNYLANSPLDFYNKLCHDLS